jgi:hypothetical protein
MVDEVKCDYDVMIKFYVMKKIFRKNSSRETYLCQKEDLRAVGEKVSRDTFER